MATTNGREEFETSVVPIVRLLNSFNSYRISIILHLYSSLMLQHGA